MVSYIIPQGNHNDMCQAAMYFIVVSYIILKGNHNPLGFFTASMITVSYIILKGNQNYPVNRLLQCV